MPRHLLTGLALTVAIAAGMLGGAVGTAAASTPAATPVVSADAPAATPVVSADAPPTGSPDLRPAAASGAATQAAPTAPDGAATETGTSGIGGGAAFLPLGTIFSVARAGILVTAYRFDNLGRTLFEKSATSDADGRYLISGLPAGTYYVQFYDGTDAAAPVYGWYEEEPFAPFGRAVQLVDGQVSTNIYGTALAGSTVTGRVTCEQCTTVPDVASLRVELAAWNPSRNAFIGIETISASPDGSFAFDRVVPSTGGFVVNALYNGADSLAASSSSAVFYPRINGDAFTADVLLARHVEAVAATDPATNYLVNALYWDFLARTPSADEVYFWSQRLQNGHGSGEVAKGFVTSDEYRLIRIDAAYRTILGREPDADGRIFWLRGMQAGRITTDDIEKSFYSSDEYLLRSGGTVDGFTTALYSTLLHREPSADDLAFWGRQFFDHGRSWVVARFWESTETISERVGLMYEKYLGRRPDADGLASWVALALRIGDSGLRAGLSGSVEYGLRAQTRYTQA